MSALKICRICLASEVKLYKYDRYGLKKCYEQVMVSKINEKEGLPRHFCFECAAMLHKFHKFKEKCYNGQKVLRELIAKGPITTKSIRNIDRQTINLQSSLNLIRVNHRVRTYIVKSKLSPKLPESEIITENTPETISITDDNDHADDFEDKYDFQPLPEVIDVNATVEDEMVHLDVNNEEIQRENEKILPEESVIIIDNNVFSLNERLLTEHDKLLPNAVQETVDDIESIEKEAEVVVEKKKEHAKGSKKKEKEKDGLEEMNRKAKKFEINKNKNTELDPNNWLKFNLSEEEAEEEFKARAQHKRFISAEYKCNDCLKAFSKEDMLNRHIKLRHSESAGPMECRFCRIRFKSQYFLKTHMVQHYTKYKCLRCDLVCPLKSTALFHDDYHNGVIIKCAHCDNEFKHKTTYYTHLRTYHRSEHVCTLCGASFVSKVGLGIHKKIKHINAESEIAESAQDKDEYCKRCDIEFKTKEAYEEHLIHSAMHADGIEDSAVQASSGTTRSLKKRRQDLKRGRRKKPTDCYVCGKHFLTQAACRKHLLADHPGSSIFAPNERHICEICGMSLAPGSVAIHLNTHTRETLYTCDTCGRDFSSKCGLVKHQLTHTSEKPVACTLCDKRFKQVSSMRLHYRTFHLKEPYPKRNRKKDAEGVLKLEDYLGVRSNCFYK